MSASARARNVLKAQALRMGLLLRRVPAGRQGDSFADQAYLLDRESVRHVLDVGAYHGETALAYRKLFPTAQIHCFEPVSASFIQLEQAVSRVPRVVAHRLAVTDSSRTVDLHVSRFAATSSLLPPAKDIAETLDPGLLDVAGTESAEATTIDEYCREREIDRVDVLKLDIQGGELAAVRGADRMLAEGKISLVYTEVLVHRLYDGQPNASQLLDALERYGYRLYGLYNFAFGRDSSLYQMDALMISPSLRGNSTAIHHFT